MLAVTALTLVGIIVALVLWFWIHRGGESLKHLNKVTISGFDRIAQKEFGSDGSGDFPPTAEAYFIGPAGSVEVSAPGFTITKVAQSDGDLPGAKLTTIYRGQAPPNCRLDIERLYPTAEIPNWVHLSASQLSAFGNGSMQVLQAGMICRG